MDFITLIKDSIPTLLTGFGMTLEITVISLIIATIVGLVTGLINISSNKMLRAIAIIYIDIIRGTPLIVQAFFIYFGLPAALDIKISATTAGITAISLNAGAYLAEIFRAGILSIDHGQTEAGRCLGLSQWKTMRKIILPQAIKRMIPAIINQYIISIKDTSILSVIGIQELTQSGQIIIASTFRAFDIWIAVGLMYFVLITTLSYTSRGIERRLKV